MARSSKITRRRSWTPWASFLLSYSSHEIGAWFNLESNIYEAMYLITFRKRRSKDSPSHIMPGIILTITS
jgi:hypothetical protein